MSWFSKPRASRFVALACGIASLAGAACVRAAEVDAAKSAIVAVSHQMNVPVEGRFKKFAAQIDFDPAKPAAGKARIDVDIGSYDLGDDSYDAQVRGKDWLDAADFPHAVFASTAIVPAGAGKFSVAGRLTIKGKTVDVIVPVSYAQRGREQVFDGVLPIRRLQFGVGGSGDWKDTSVVADNVEIKFHLVVAH